MFWIQSFVFLGGLYGSKVGGLGRRGLGFKSRAYLVQSLGVRFQASRMSRVVLEASFWAQFSQVVLEQNEAVVISIIFTGSCGSAYEL